MSDDLKKAKLKIDDLIAKCDSMEKSAKKSEQLLAKHSDKIQNDFEYVKTVSMFISKDRYIKSI